MFFLKRFWKQLAQPRQASNAPHSKTASRADMDYNNQFFESQLSIYRSKFPPSQESKSLQLLSSQLSFSTYEADRPLLTSALTETLSAPLPSRTISYSTKELSQFLIPQTNATFNVASSRQPTVNMTSPKPNPILPTRDQINQPWQITTTQTTEDIRKDTHSLGSPQVNDLTLNNSENENSNGQQGIQQNGMNGSALQTTDKIDFLDKDKKIISSALDTFLRQAEMYIKQKNWEKALSTCDRALALSPDSAEAYKLKGNVFQYTSQPAEAMGCYAEALVINPQYPEVHANLGTLYGTVDDWEKAVACYEKAVEVAPEFIQAYRHLANAWDKLNKPENRVNAICQALSLSPENFTVNEHLEMGYHLLENGRENDAIECFQRVLSLDPNHVETHQRVAQCLEKQGNWEQAVHHYNKALSIVSSEPKPTRQSIPAAQLPSRRQLALPTQKIAINTQSQAATSQISNTSNTSNQSQEAVAASVQSLISSARTERQNQNFEKAIDNYRNALKLSPNDANIYRELTEVFEQASQTSQAIESRYRMLRLQPEWGTAQEHCTLGNTFQQKGDRQKAINCYTQAIQLNPLFSQAIEQLAQLTTPAIATSVVQAQLNSAPVTVPSQLQQTAQKKNSVDEQATPEQTALLNTPSITAPDHTSPDNNEQEAMELHKKGEAFFNEQHWEKAIAAFTQAIELNPNFSWSHHMQGKALFEIKDWHGAVDAQKKAIALNTEFFWSHTSLGDALSQLQQWEEATNAYQKALNLDPDCYQIICKLADTLKRCGQANLEKASSLYLKGSQAEEAEETIYREALALNPQAIDIYLKLARVLTTQNRLDEVIFTYQTARHFAPDNIEILMGLYKVLSQKKQWDSAADCLHHALQIEPTNSNLYFSLGELYSCVGKLSEALDAFQKSIQLNPSSHWTYQALGNVYIWMGQPEQAVRAYQQAIAIESNFAAAYKQMGDALTALGRDLDASAAYSKALELDPHIL